MVVILSGNSENITTPVEETNNEKFYFYDKDGNKFSISDFKEKPIALILWSSDTNYSFETLEMIEKNYADYKDKITFLMINTQEKTSDIIETMTNCGYSFPVYYDKDNQAAKYYEYQKLPTLIFFNSDGTKSNQKEGEISEDSLLANLDLISENY